MVLLWLSQKQKGYFITLELIANSSNINNSYSQDFIYRL